MRNEYVIIDQSTNQPLAVAQKLLNTTGYWASYNLTFKNLLNGTSFNFSLNLTHFPLDVFGVAHSIIFNSTSQSHSGLFKIWNNHANYFNVVVTIDFNQMLTVKVDNVTENIADFGTDAAAAFFLNQIHYHYWFSTYIDWKSYTKSYIVWQNTDYVIKLKNLNSTSENDLMDGVTLPADKDPIPYVGGVETMRHDNGIWVIQF